MTQKSPKPRLERYMIRPVIYQVFTRFLIGLCLAKLWDFFVNAGSVRVHPAWGYAFFAGFYGVMAWLAYLRLDGLKVPKFDRKLFRRHKSPERAFGDMIDYVDEPIVSFDELDDAEKDLTLLISNLICLTMFVAASLLA